MNPSPLALATNECFTYWLDISPVDALRGQHVLTIRSQFMGAVDPAERRRQSQLVIPLSDVQALHQYLTRYLLAHSNS